MSEHECVFVEEQEPEGRLILPPCLVCGESAMDALGMVRESLEQAEVDTERKVTVAMRAKLESACAERERLREGGIGLIAAERLRQIEQEGWTPEHDDDHNDGELAWAAASYAIPATREPFYEGEEPEYLDEDGIPTTWPWEPYYWKPTPDDRVRELVKAGALIAAEIDRLTRLAAGALPATTDADAEG